MTQSIHHELNEILKDKQDHASLKIGNNTLRIEKRFRPPITKYFFNMYKKKDKLRYNKLRYDILPNYDFYLRFYLPRNVMVKQPYSNDEQKFHVIIMFNGLDESLPQHYQIYDRLGSSFATHGIASVLLPTPFHLKRASVVSGELLNGKPKYIMPSSLLEKNPWHLPNIFSQNIYEFKYLLKLLNCKNDAKEDEFFKDLDINELTGEDIVFYNLFFGGKKLDISVLGYSLGGLMALSCFKQDPEPIKSCILLNSGGAIKNLKLGAPFMKNEDWLAKVVEPLQQAKDKSIPEYKIFEKCKHNQIIHSILFEDQQVFKEKKYDRHVEKLIIVAGGKDRLVEPESIKRLETTAHGLNILQISDLGHFISDDPQFNRWYSRIINLIIDFFEDIGGESISKDANIILFSILDYCCGNEIIKIFNDLKELPQLSEIVKQKAGKDIIDDFYLLSRSILNYHKSITDVTEKNEIIEAGFISKLNKFKNNNKLYFCQIAMEDGFTKTSHDSLEKAIKDNIPSGKKLVKKGDITDQQVKAILLKQTEKYSNLLLGNDILTEYWKDKLFPILNQKKDEIQML